MTCTWPTGCSQNGESDDPDGLCCYHRKVLAGLITPALPGTPQERGEEPVNWYRSPRRRRKT